MVTGVYLIWHEDSKTGYIGSAAKSFEFRWGWHRRELHCGTSKHKHLQAAWNKYGEAAFEFKIVLECEPDKCLLWEQFCLDYAKNEGVRLYNTYLVAGSPLGVKLGPRPDEVKLKISVAQKGRKQNEERRKKSAVAMLGKRHSEETKERMSTSQRSRRAKEQAEGTNWRSEETVQKMSEALKGVPWTAKRWIAHLGIGYIFDAICALSEVEQQAIIKHLGVS